jgi:hypothetical protein
MEDNLDEIEGKRLNNRANTSLIAKQKHFLAIE